MLLNDTFEQERGVLDKDYLLLKLFLKLIMMAMKHLFSLLFFLATGIATLSAQSAEAKPPSENTTGTDEALAREATEKLVDKYTLDADQAKEMYTIQQRKLRNMAGLESLQTSNRSLYLAKLESLQKGTLNSIRRILHTKEQVELYQQTQHDIRTRRSDKRRELAQQKLPKDDIQAAVLDIYEE